MSDLVGHSSRVRFPKQIVSIIPSASQIAGFHFAESALACQRLLFLSFLPRGGACVRKRVEKGSSAVAKSRSRERFDLIGIHGPGEGATSGERGPPGFSFLCLEPV